MFLKLSNGVKMLMLFIFLISFSWGAGLGTAYDSPNEFNLRPGEIKEYGIRITNFHYFDINLTIDINDPNNLTRIKEGELSRLLAPEEKASLLFLIEAPKDMPQNTTNTIYFNFGVLPTENISTDDGRTATTEVGASIRVRYTIVGDVVETVEIVEESEDDMCSLDGDCDSELENNTTLFIPPLDSQENSSYELMEREDLNTNMQYDPKMMIGLGIAFCGFCVILMATRKKRKKGIPKKDEPEKEKLKMEEKKEIPKHNVRIIEDKKINNLDDKVTFKRMGRGGIL